MMAGMNQNKINGWLTLAANVGVVIGIFALLAELRHSSQVAEVAAYQTRISEIQEINLELALSSDLASLLVKYKTEGVGSLTPQEYSRVRSWYAVILRQMQGQYYQYQNGFLERAVIDRTLQDISNGIYQSWGHLDLLKSIEIDEWRAEIDHVISKKDDER